MTDLTRRSIVGMALVGAAAPGVAASTFDVHWTEEVQLASGSLLLVELKYTYESLSRIDRYGSAILRRTDIAFDAGPGIGRFSRSFDHHRVDMIQLVDGHWYLVLETRGGPPYEKLPDGTRQQIWGPPENAFGQKCWRLDDRGFVRASLLDVPEAILKRNLLMDYPPVKELAALDGSRVTLADKAALASRFPVSPPAGRIARPRPQSNR